MDNKIDINRIIEMAWEDRTTFDSIKDQFGLKEQEVIKIMRKNMKRSCFELELPANRARLLSFAERFR